MIDWCYFGSRRFVDPFFSQTVESCLRSPFNLLFRHQAPVQVLEEIRAVRQGVPPAGFVFHVSRCGSTLVSQMLASLSENIMISEAPVIDSAITGRKANASVTHDERSRWLTGILNALGQPRTGLEQRLFVKFDAWDILDFPVVRRAFPNVPWIFLYRDPVEVLVSQLNHRGAHMVPGVIDPELFGLDSARVTNLLPEEYCAAVLAALFKAGLNHHQEGGRLVNYSELPEVVFSRRVLRPQLEYRRTNCDADGIEVGCKESLSGVSKMIGSGNRRTRLTQLSRQRAPGRIRFTSNSNVPELSDAQNLSE